MNSSTPNPQPDPLSSLAAKMKHRAKRAEEETALLAKIKAGTATPAEVERYENRPVVYHLYGGQVEVTAAPKLSVEEWKRKVARSKGHTGPLIAEEKPTGDPS